jgi:polyhydroxyalkanoate synthesis regulator phasin
MEVKVMSGIIEKTIFLGLGVLTMTRDKVAATVDDLVKSGEVEAEESRKLIDELLAKGEAEQKELKKLIKQELDKLHTTVVPVTKDEFNTLSKKIDELAAQLDELMTEKQATN